MTEISNDAFMVAFGNMANQLGYDSGYELLRYSKVITTPIEIYRSVRYPYNADLFWTAMGKDDTPCAFEHDGRLYALIRTRHNRGERALHRFRTLSSITKGRVTCDHRSEADPDPIIALCRNTRTWKKSTIFWFSIPKPDVDPRSALSRISTAEPVAGYEYGGFVIDLQVCIQEYDYPKRHLWTITKRGQEDNLEWSVGLRSIFPEMEEAYERRSSARWYRIFDTIPGRITLESWCNRNCTRPDGSPCDCTSWSLGILFCHGREHALCTEDDESYTEESDSGDDTASTATSQDGDTSSIRSQTKQPAVADESDIDESDTYDRDLFEYAYIGEYNEWIPVELQPEYRLYRLRQKRLRRLLTQRCDDIVNMLYRPPAGAMYKKTSCKTLVGKQVDKC